MKIHANLKWSTIISRANKLAGFDKFRYDTAYSSIYIYSSAHNAYLFIANTLFNKENFIEDYI